MVFALVNTTGRRYRSLLSFAVGSRIEFVKIVTQLAAAWLLITLGSLGMISWLGFALTPQGFDPHRGFFDRSSA